jgi:hypothetical protein
VSEGRFSASDLEPSADEKRAILRDRAERGATVVAVLSLGVWIGGMIALGACAAPFVFSRTPKPFSGDAMGAAFARFDAIALGAAVLLLGAEVVRTWAARKRGRVPVARVRRYGAINEMHRAGIERHVGEEGAKLEAIHKRAEAVGKAEVTLGMALIALHVLTLGAGRREDDEDDDLEAPTPGPLPPGPLG